MFWPILFFEIDIVQIIPAILRNRISHRPQLIKIIDNIGWISFDHIIRFGFGFFVSVWIARQLGPQQLGQLNYAIAYISIFNVFVGLGLDNIVFRELVKKPDEEHVILSTAALLLAASGISFVLIGLGIAHVFDMADDTTRLLIMLSALPLLFRPLDVASISMAVKLQNKYIVFVRTSVFLAFNTIKVIILLTGASVYSITLATSAEVIVISIGIFIVSFYRGTTISVRTLSVQLAKQFLVRGFPLLLSSLSIMIYWRIDQIMLGEIVGNDEVGIYSMAIKISEIWYFLPSAVITTLATSIIKTKQLDAKLYVLRMQGLCAFIIWLSVAVSLGCMVFAPIIVPILLGSNYIGVTPILLVHIWGSVFIFLGGISMYWYMNENMERVFLYRTATGALLNVGLNFILLPHFGGLGAAIATVISYSCVGLFLDALSRKTRPLFIVKLKAFNPFSSIPLIRQALKSS